MLDLNLPGRHGLDVLRGLRAAGNPVPVLVLTAMGKTSERVEGLTRTGVSCCTCAVRVLRIPPRTN